MAGCTPIKGKKFWVTRALFRRSVSPVPDIWVSPTPIRANPAMSENDLFCSRKSRKLLTWMLHSWFAIHTRRPGSRNGSGRSSRASITLKTKELAPMPSPAIRMTNIVNPASRRMPRKAWRRSCARSFIQRAIHNERASSEFCVMLPNFLRAMARASGSGEPCAIRSCSHRFDVEFHFFPQQALPFAARQPIARTAARTLPPGIGMPIHYANPMMRATAPMA